MDMQCHVLFNFNLGGSVRSLTDFEPSFSEPIITSARNFWQHLILILGLLLWLDLCNLPLG